MRLYGWILARLASRLAWQDKLYQVILWIWNYSPRAWITKVKNEQKKNQHVTNEKRA